MFVNKKILILSPHTDDCELCMGGSMSRLSKEAKEIKVICLSVPKLNKTPEYTNEQTLLVEFKRSMLTFDKLTYVNYFFSPRLFPTYRQDILEVLHKENLTYKPDVVFLPCDFDTHQDHQIVNQEGKRAFKNCSIFGYEAPWNHTNIESPFFLSISSDDIQIKLKALSEYQSQIKLDRKYFQQSVIISLSIVRGLQSGFDYAELFQTIQIKF
jgi:LmbE family N-acetylglucosaminyl deacetylase